MPPATDAKPPIAALVIRVLTSRRIMKKRHLPRRKFSAKIAIAAIGCTLLLAACGSVGAAKKTSAPSAVSQKTSAASAKSSTSMTFSLDFAIDGLHAPVFVAQHSGYFASDGLKVSIEPSGGSQDSITRVAAGEAQMGFADSGTVLKAIASQHLPIMVVGVLLEQSPVATVTLKSSGITTPEQLKGKTVGDAPATSEHAFFPALLKSAGLGTSDASRVALSPASIVPTLLAKRVNAVNIYEQVFAKYANQVNFIPWDKYGLIAYGTSIIVNDSFASAHPQAVSAFLKDTYKGLSYTLGHPTTAANIVAGAAGNSNVAFYTAELKILLQFWTKPNAAGQYGLMSSSLWNKTQKLNLTYGEQQTPLKLSSVYTNKYLTS